MSLEGYFDKIHETIYYYTEYLSELYRYSKFNFEEINKIFEKSTQLFQKECFTLLESELKKENQSLIRRREILGYYRILMEYFPIKNHYKDFFSYESMKQTKKFKTDLGRLTFYDLRNKMINEFDHDKRSEILIVYNESLNKFPQLYQKIYQTMQNMAQNLSYNSILEWTVDKQICDISKFYANAIEFLDRKKKSFQKKIGIFSEQIMGIQSDKFNFSDIWHIYGMADLNRHIDKTQISFHKTDTIFKYFNGLNYKLLNVPNLNIDSEERVGKNPRAFSGNSLIPNNIPSRFKTTLVINPISSFLDQREIMHETTHAVHFLNIDPTLKPIFHIAFDPTTTEIIAALFESLFRKNEFLEKNYRISKTDSEIIIKYFDFFNEYLCLNHTLNFVSQYNFLKEKNEFTPEFILKNQELYEKRHLEIFGFERNGTDFLARELDKFFGSLIYSRAYVCSHSLEKKIQTEDSDWFNNSSIAERIRNNYMKYGFSRDIDELLKDWGIDPYFFPE